MEGELTKIEYPTLGKVLELSKQAALTDNCDPSYIPHRQFGALKWEYENLCRKVERQHNSKINKLEEIENQIDDLFK